MDTVVGIKLKIIFLNYAVRIGHLAEMFRPDISYATEGAQKKAINK